MPHSALSRTAATLVALCRRRRSSARRSPRRPLWPPTTATARPRGTSSRAASLALSRAQDALAGKGGDATMALRDLWAAAQQPVPGRPRGDAEAAGRPSQAEQRLLVGNVLRPLDPGEVTRRLLARTGPQHARQRRPAPTRGAGYRKPKPDGALGGNSKIDIYVDNLAAGPLRLLHHRPARPRPARTGTTSGPSACSTTTTPASRPTPRGEPPGDRGARVLPRGPVRLRLPRRHLGLEGSAAWVEDELYDDVNDNVQYLNDEPDLRPRARSTRRAGSSTTAPGPSSAG